jgi:hypothetical protein
MGLKLKFRFEFQFQFFHQIYGSLKQTFFIQTSISLIQTSLSWITCVKKIKLQT